MASVFITGASGLIGGQALVEVIKHPREYGSIRALVRSSESAEKVKKAYSQVQIVNGSLDDVALVEEEAAKADIVLNVASNKHINSMRAIHKGLVKRQSSSYWVQVSGASVLAADELASSSFQPGSPSDVVFDDVADAAKIRSLIRAYPTRAIDNYILDVVAEHHPKIRTAIIFPPIVYGHGEGPVNQTSIQIPNLCRQTLSRGQALQVGKGLSRWGSVHVRDIAKVFAELADAGANGCEDSNVWGENGLYFPSANEVSFGEVSELIAQEAHKNGHIASTDIEQISPEDALKLLPGGSVFFGTNARIKSRRAAEELKLKGWDRDMPSEISRALQEEASKK